MLKKYDAENPANKIPMTSRFIWSHPAHMLASCFGVGGCSSAPGTVGSVMAALLYIVFAPSIPTKWWQSCSLWLVFGPQAKWLPIWASKTTRVW